MARKAEKSPATVVGTLSRVSAGFTIAAAFVTICLGVSTTLNTACNTSFLSSACSAGPVAKAGSDLAVREGSGVDRSAEKASIPRGPEPAKVKASVWHRDGVAFSEVRKAMGALENEGFLVREGPADLGNVVGVKDRSAGRIVVKSIAALRDVRRPVQSALQRAFPTKPFGAIGVVDVDIPSGDPGAVSRGGEVQVDMF